jgi:hypothetical protein
MTRLLVAALALAASVALAQEVERPPFITTPNDVVFEMLRFAGTGPSDLVVDLGSGDGRIPIAAATQFGARGLGIELDPDLVERARRNALAARVADRVRFVQGDVLLADFSQASVVTVYLLPSLMNRLQPRLLGELRPGTRILSHAFIMTSWVPDRTQTMRVAQRESNHSDFATFHLWVVPANARGRWSGGAWELVIQQNFQQLDIEAKRDGRAVAVSQASLSGEEVRWEAGGARFVGRIGSGAITGTLDGAPLVLEKR